MENSGNKKRNIRVLVTILILLGVTFASRLILPQFIRQTYTPDVAEGNSYQDPQFGFTVSYPLTLFLSINQSGEIDFVGGVGDKAVVTINKSTTMPDNIPGQPTLQTKSGLPIYVSTSQNGDVVYVISYAPSKFISISGPQSIAFPIAQDIR